MIVTQGLTKHFIDAKGGTVKAVDDLSFVARPGRVFGLLGCNGAGKTTTLRMLSTVVLPTAGRALRATNRVASLPPLSLRGELAA